MDPIVAEPPNCCQWIMSPGPWRPEGFVEEQLPAFHPQGPGSVLYLDKALLCLKMQNGAGQAQLHGRAHQGLRG